jgi:hypothetical protein
MLMHFQRTPFARYLNEQPILLAFKYCKPQEKCAPPPVQAHPQEYQYALN